MGYETGFTRTPKHGVKGAGESVARKRYKAAVTLPAASSSSRSPPT